ncbi:Hdr-like menaquinol oxidoreductase iron-sulfur, subunit 1 [uncultured Desulfatiglans sp.]|uniref:Hdr-like menaquinol oxidoreductase iron-sulfur, subunit 1 n=1 Tax=Uncultured Desulfatiglans sp. TaxID=1748965 RepID=A0A653AI28_UNCDX|nr:Hdr-like menaquinol oxidoreductase iron-sulfur, subunit 1 [uncultured Desulfatiglans sp.]
MKGIDRREFLKIGGMAAIAGLGGKAALEILAPGKLEAAQQIPLTKGKHWAMVVDTTKMDDALMDVCIEACHKEHNVPNLGNPKEEIKWIWKETYEHAFPGQEHEFIGERFHGMNFLLMCNHCTNPPCVRVCPTQSTWKREDGIVMMDMHRCIGCRFCMAACPYGARSFNWGDPQRVRTDEELMPMNPGFPLNKDYPTRSKGVVEKCNFCAERLAKGDQPACVEAAAKVRKGALVFGDLADPHSEVRKVLKEHYTIRRKPELGTGPNLFFIV